MIEKPRVHFIGIGGIGMSSLARWFLAQNWVVSGYDLAKGAITRDLAKARINVKIGHKKGNIMPGTGLIIKSQAIRPDNPELREARRRKLQVLSYPEMVGKLTRAYSTVAIAGAHGKSTVTALVALAAEDLDPTVIVGTKLKEFGDSNFRLGESEHLILEADEYGRAFLNYSPALTVVTNIDREHLDVYGSLAGIKSAFLAFLSNLREGGIMILNRDDANLRSLERRIEAVAKKKGAKTVWYSLREASSKRIARHLGIPGRHNLSNALAAYHAAKSLGIPETKILSAFSAYRGAWRRMEYRGKYRGALVFDDYAHHPSEIKATLAAFREKYPERKLLCVFEPHQIERLERLFREFQTAFQLADETLILPVYRVAGRESKKPGADSERLVRAIQKKFPRKPLFYLPSPRNLTKAIDALDGDTSHKVIVMMGAGSVADLTRTLVSGR